MTATHPLFVDGLNVTATGPQLENTFSSSRAAAAEGSTPKATSAVLFLTVSRFEDLPRDGKAQREMRRGLSADGRGGRGSQLGIN
mmetsp:Transcript_6591/g.13520  ORF Transcript_6591/g.13520 Transcript_6591/m.13520 type:complete len:85 (+) Transcript_6591:281-535(+)